MKKNAVCYCFFHASLLKFGLCCGILFLCPQLSIAQKAVFTNYSAKDGLVANPVLQVFQDANGFMWFGTSYGLSRYDGNRFTNFTEQNGLVENTFSLIYEDLQKHVNVFFSNGEQMKFENGSFQRVEREKPLYVSDIYYNPDGSSVMATNEDGILRVEKEKIFPVTGPIRGIVNCYLPLPNGNFLAGGQFFNNDTYSTSLFLYNSTGQLLDQAHAGIPFDVFNLFEDNRERIWVCAGNGLKLLSKTDAENGKIRLLTLPSPFDSPMLPDVIHDMIQDKTGNIWIGTLKGLFKVNPYGSLSHFSEQKGMISDHVLDLLEDKEGNIWIGTLKGVSKIPLNANILYYGTADGLADNDIQSVRAKNKDEVYFTTVNGKLQKFNYQTRQVTTLASFSPGFLKLYRTSQHNFYLAAGKERWTAYDLYRFFPETGKIKKLVSVPQTFFRVEEDAYGNLFLASNKGLLIFNTHLSQPEIFAGVDTRVNHLLLDSNANLWLSCLANKLYKVKLHHSAGAVSGESVDMSRFIANAFPGRILLDVKGNLWVGSRSDGIWRLQFNGDTIDTLHISDKDGLMSFAGSPAIEDRSGNILLISQLGIDKIILQNNTGKVYNLSRESGFFDEIWDVAYLEENDVYWIATSSGLVRFEDKQTEQSPPSDVFIIDIEQETDIGISKERLPYNFGSIHIHFASPNFVNERSTRFSYRLLGSAEQHWSIPSHQHSVQFAELKPGKYTFEVRSVSWNGQPGKSVSYAFSVAPPWWDTGWFRGLVVLITTVYLYLLIKRRIARIRRNADLKRKILETELMALRAQMNPHFIFNCLNNIDAFIQANDKYNATMYLNKFAKLLRNVLDSSQQKLVPLSKDLETLKLYTDLEQLRDRDKYKVVYSIDSELANSDHEVPPLIVQPYVENAIIHGLRKKESSDGLLTITVKKVVDGIQYVIEDNGAGRKASVKQHDIEKSSYGMQISSDRVKYFNREDKASVTIFDLEANRKAAGTRVEVVLNTGESM